MNADNSEAPSFEEGEIGQMRKKYSDTLPLLKELFPDWKDEDLIFALEDSNGEVEDAIVRITEGWIPRHPYALELQQPTSGRIVLTFSFLN